MRYIILFFISFSLLAAADKSPRTAIALYGGVSNIDIIKNAEEVTACVLNYTPPREENGRFVENEKYSEGAYLVVPVRIATKLKSALIGDSTYGWDYAKPCHPRWHTKVKFRKGRDVISVQFCFGCHILDIRINDKYVALEDFEGTIFIDTMRALFPNDEALKPEEKQRKHSPSEPMVTFPN